MRLDNKVAIVTGGSSGIGKETVFKFLSEGASVVAADINTETLDQLDNEIAEKFSNKKFTSFKCDVSKEEEIKNLVDHTVEKYKQLNIVFNNAGVGGAFGPITHIDQDDWNKSLEILLNSVFFGIKHASKIMINKGSGGSIINTASIAGMAAGSGPHV